MSKRLRVGIIGVGFLAALAAGVAVPARRAEPLAVTDQLPARAEKAARQLGRRAAAGPAELIHCDDVEAILLLSRQWFGHWPLTLAASLGKPVYCAVSLASDEAHVERVDREVRAAGLKVQVALSPWATPALAGLRRKLGAASEQPLVVRVECWRKGGNPDAEQETRARAMPGVVDAVAWLLGSPPRLIRAVAAPARHFATFLIDFGENRLAQISFWHSIMARSGCRFHVETANGSLLADPPGRLSWQDDAGRHVQHYRHLPWRLRDLADFAAALRDDRPTHPDYAAARRALAWSEAARRALEEGRPVTLDPEPPVHERITSADATPRG